MASNNNLSQTLKDKKYTVSSNFLDSHQSQPGCIVKFFSFVEKDTYHKSDAPESGNIDYIAVNQITVVSDIVSATIQSSKGSPVGSAEVVLVSGSVNYLAALAPGDYCMIWLFNDESVRAKMETKIANNESSNDFNSGLKFFGRVNSIRGVYNTDVDGTKTLRYVVTLKSFAEFLTSIYYNYYLADVANGNQGGAQNQTAQAIAILSDLSKNWFSLVPGADQQRPVTNIGNIMQFVINTFLGSGPLKRDATTTDPVTGKTVVVQNRIGNTLYRVPKEVALILNFASDSSVYTFQDILTELIGVQNYNNTVQPFQPNMSPLSGQMVGLPSNFMDTTVWSYIMAHLNSPLNEAYNTLRIDEDGDIEPTFVARQLPFTTQYSKYHAPKVTPFTSLPRWIIDSTRAVQSFNIGTSDAARVNYLQTYGQIAGIESAFTIQRQIDQGNLRSDVNDIKRNGLKTYVIGSNCDVLSSDSQTVLTGFWTDILGDCFINGHLKLNGTMAIAGIQEPICIGDNLQYNGFLFHIESLSHTYSLNEGSGVKTFMTNVQLSNGISTDGDYYISESNQRKDLTEDAAPGYTDLEKGVNNKLITSGTSAAGGSAGNPTVQSVTSAISQDIKTLLS